MKTFLRLRPAVFAAAGALLACSAIQAQVAMKPSSSVASGQTVQFNLILPLENSSQLDALIGAQQTSGSSSYRQWLTPAGFQQKFGPSAAHVSQATTALEAYGLKVLGTFSHGLQVEGTASAIEAAFGAKLSNAAVPGGGTKVISTTPLTMPSTLTQLGAHVLAFSPKVHVAVHSLQVGQVTPQNEFSPYGPYWATDFKQAYQFPSYQVLNGQGRKIGIVCSGDFQDSDIAAYFANEGLTPPSITRVPVDGGAPFGGSGSLETSNDIEQAGTMAPNAAIYFYNMADLSDQSVLDAYTAIVQSNAVDVVSSSFGGPEAGYTAAYNGGVDYTWELQVFEDVFRQGNAEGITFVASSGDLGAVPIPTPSYFSGEPATFTLSVDWPASSPHVTGVGGTNLQTTYNPPSLESKYISENAYGNALAPYDPYGLGVEVPGGYYGSGGGVSVVFPKPLYQFLVKTGASMRTVPDISLQMGSCPGGVPLLGPCSPDSSATIVAFDGGFYGVIGTSVAAPDIAGLIALADENLRIRLGNANFLIYALAAGQEIGLYKAFHQGIPGYNGYYYSEAGVPGYTKVLGNGTVIGTSFILAPFAPAAGNQQTPSNP
jgi:subtilase family serine protease